MAGNARFHNKLHRRNHHSVASAGYPDSGSDPIASPAEPFLGDFHMQGSLSALNNLTVDGNATVKGNLSALGTFSYIDTFVTVTSAMSVVNTGTGPAFTVKQTGAQPVALFLDDNAPALTIQDGGFVGVGTFFPNEKLTVVGVASASMAMSSPNVSANNVFLKSKTLITVPNNSAAAPNLFIGDSTTGNNNATGNHNFVFGISAGNALTSGSYNIFMGRLTGRVNISGNDNNFLGNSAGACNTTGCNNNFFGKFTGQGNNNGSNNNFLGFYAGRGNTTGSFNNFLGSGAGCVNTTGSFNNFLGSGAGCDNATGNHNNFLGRYAGRYNTTGSNNNFLGRYAGQSNTTGDNNNFLGRYAGYSNTTGSNNNFNGYSAGILNNTGSGNNFLGTCAGGGNACGSNNNFIGSFAGCCNNSGSNNIIIGTEANVASDALSGVVVLGTCAVANASNQLMLGSITNKLSGTLNGNLILTHQLSALTPNYAALNVAGKAPLSGSALGTDSNFHLIQGRMGVNTSPVSSYALHIRGGNIRVDGVDYSSLPSITALDTDGQSLFDLRSGSRNSNYSLSISESGLNHFFKFFGGRQGDANPFIAVNNGDSLRFAQAGGFFFQNGFIEMGRFDLNGNFGIGSFNYLNGSEGNNLPLPAKLTVTGNISSNGPLSAFGPTVLGGLPTGAGAAPAGLPSGALWVDTSASNTLKVVP